MAAKLVIIAELPGSGKTTLARRLEAEYPGIRMSADDWMDSLAINLHSETEKDRIEQLQWKLAQQLLALGNTVIVEWAPGDNQSETGYASALVSLAHRSSVTTFLRLLRGSTGAFS